MSQFIVIGAGQAGQSIVTTLRAKGFDGKITLIGDEAAPPYQRPPLSKSYLLGDMELDRIYLRPQQYYTDENIDLITGREVSSIDPVAKT
ncbi:MAG: FAD-dependent oxidoreductase, partial [Celeribacter marinus]